MTQKRPKRKDSLYSRCFHVVFTKGRESQKSGVPPVRIVQSTHGRDARATTWFLPENNSDWESWRDVRRLPHAGFPGPLWIAGAGGAAREMFSGNVAGAGSVSGADTDGVAPASDGTASVGAGSDGVTGVKAGPGVGGASNPLMAGCVLKMSR
jgi:hypothetical protein